MNGKRSVTGLPFGLLLLLSAFCLPGFVWGLPEDPVGYVGAAPAIHSSSNETSPPLQANQPRAVAAAKPQLSYGNAILAEDTTWQGEVLIEGVVTVASQATLTISAGTVVRFSGIAPATPRGGLLLVQGRLLATGSKERPVLFTSKYVKPMAGDWQGIVILGSDKKNVLENCRLEGAETGLEASFSTVVLKNSTFTGSVTGARLQDSLLTQTGGGATGCATGLFAVDSEVDIRDAVFSGNRQGLKADRTSLYLQGNSFTRNDSEGLSAVRCQAKIAASSFTANGGGLLLSSTQGSVAGCRFTENADYGIAISDSRVKVYGNEIAKNGSIGMKVEDGKGVAWGNSFFANGAFDLVNTGNEDFRAIGNWWGGSSLAETEMKIYDYRANNARGRVLYVPVLESKPAIIP